MTELKESIKEKVGAEVVNTLGRGAEQQVVYTSQCITLMDKTKIKVTPKGLKVKSSGNLPPILIKELKDRLENEIHSLIEFEEWEEIFEEES